MSDAAAADVADKVVDEVVKDDAAAKGTEKAADKALGADKGVDAGKAGADTKAADEAAKGDSKAKEFVADSTKTDAENDAARAEFEKAEAAADKKGLADDWREVASGGDEDLLKMLKRYGSLSSVAKALKESKDAIRTGKVRQPMPDAKDEKAMAEWRKAEGIPGDPTGYKLPDDVLKRLTDEDKPILANFTEFAHKNNARPDVIEIASKWYVEMEELGAAKRIEEDAAASEETEDTLRKDWAHGEYKSSMALAKRFVEGVPGVGADWAEARMPNGRRLGDNPAFVAWAAEQGKERWGDSAFITSDGESKHTARKTEIEKIRDTDFARYENEGLDKEYRKILEKDLARGKR